MTRNKNMAALKAGYLFPEVARRRRAFAEAHPDAHIISLGVGNTTEPLPKTITKGLVDGAARLGTMEGYVGYTDEGFIELRQKISEVYYKGQFSADEIFVSDGAKCDIGRLQILFGSAVSIAVQDPSYPVYVDGSIIMGVQNISFLPCTAKNNYFPDLSAIPANSLVYFCSPNNPTGAVATKEQLKALVDTARAKGCIIIFDAAYSCFIRDASLPKSIFEIEGAKECAIEVQSFSKPAGFTGVRLGWTVVPKELRYTVVSTGSTTETTGATVHSDWNRIMGTLFNGASNIAQWGGLAALSSEGQAEMKGLCDYYLGNAAIIRSTLETKGIQCIGGDNAPYVWAKFPGRDSWDVFNEILEKCQVVTTPGAGFGPAGEGYIRFSAFGHRKDVEEACKRLGCF
jgi:LL-diaminopimelate aminotransferase